MLTKKSKFALVKGIITKNSPIYVQFALCKSCNLNCKMCGATSSRRNEKELDLDEIEKLSEVLDKLNVGVLVLTGGEPFLRNDLPDVIKIFTKKGFDVRLQTNGTLATEERIKEVVNAGVKEVTISLDTLDSKKQDYIVNSKGAWDKIIRSIVLFSEILPKKGSMPIINTVVSKMNLEDVLNVVKFVTKIGFYSSLIPVHLSSNKNFILRNDSDLFKFKKEDHYLIDKTYFRLIKMKKFNYNIHNSYKFLKESPKFLKYGIVDWKCDSPNLYFSISPGGYFLPCIDLKGFKNMLDDNFLEIYRSKKFKQEIKEQVKKCLGCMYACYPEITYLCKNPFVLLERVKQALTIAGTKRDSLSYEKAMETINQIKKTKL